MRLTIIERAHFVTGQVLKCFLSVRTGDPYLSHVTHIEEPHPFADGYMLSDYSRVLNRHLPARELNDLSTKAKVLIVQRGLLHAVNPCFRLKFCKVFEMSIATVIGPTPPGTGVIAELTGATSS